MYVVTDINTDEMSSLQNHQNAEMTGSWHTLRKELELSFWHVHGFENVRLLSCANFSLAYNHLTLFIVPPPPPLHVFPAVPEWFLVD